jgi:hypothetical protein
LPSRASKVHLGTEEERLLDGVETLIKSPGCRVRHPWFRLPRSAGVRLERGRARVAAARAPDRRRDRDEREDDDERAPRSRCSALRRRATSAARSASSTGSRAGDGRRLRGLELPARGHPRVPAARRVLLNLEPDHLDRHGTFEAYRTRSCGSSRTRTATTSRSSRGLRGDPGRARGSSSRRPTSCPPSR